MKGINIFLADGFEDIEALATYDVLRRGGLDTRLVSTGKDLNVKSSHGVTIKADVLLDDCCRQDCGCDVCEKDVMIFPGGMPGSKNLASCETLIDKMKKHYANGGTVAAICAAPGLVLGLLDDWKGVEFTCFDSFETIPTQKGGIFKNAPAVRSGRIITGRSAGHAVSFGLEILRFVTDEQNADKVRYAMLLDTK